MPKMREVKKNTSKTVTNKVVIMVEMNGQMVPMTVCKPVAAPKQVTARG